MNEVNKVLGDESNNDKALIKELSVYIKNHRDKGLPINRKFIENVINIILRNSEIDHKRFILPNDKSVFASWNAIDKLTKYNLTNIKNCATKKERKRFYSKVGDNNIFIYYRFLFVIIHELTHARQDYLIEKQGNEIYSSFYELIKKNYDFYVEHHDETLCERYANLRASNLAYQTLSYIYPHKYVYELQDDIINYLLEGYKLDEYEVSNNGTYIFYEDSLISALENYNNFLEENSINRVNISPTKDMTLYDRLYLGLPITISEFDYVDSLVLRPSDKVKIKELVNRF